MSRRDSGTRVPAGASIIPTLRYRDAPGAVDFLCRAFGFREHFVVPGEEGLIAHAQLTLGGNMIMLGSARDDDFGRLQRPPASADAPVNQSAYIVIEDVDTHCARAREAGARIVREPEDQDYGGRLYSCRDPEGHLWNFGSYDPWAE